MRMTELETLNDHLPEAYVYRYIRHKTGAFEFLYISSGVESVRGYSVTEVVRDPELLRRQIDPSQLDLFERAHAASAHQLTDLIMDLRIRSEEHTSELQ